MQKLNNKDDIRPTGIKSSWIRHSLPDLVLATPDTILNLIPTRKIESYKQTVKDFYIDKYLTVCLRDVCLPCGRGQFN